MNTKNFLLRACYDSGMLEGFIAFNNAARYTTREQIALLPFDIVQYQKAEWLDTYYLVRPDYAKENTDNMLEALDKMDAYGVSFRQRRHHPAGDDQGGYPQRAGRQEEHVSADCQGQGNERSAVL